MTTQGKIRLKIWLMVLGVFALGCMTGASLSAYRLQAGNARHSKHKPDAQEVFENLKHDLNLNDQQSVQVRAIIEQTRSEYRALRAEVRPRYDALRQNARTQIRALLTEEQQKRFETIIAEEDAKREASIRKEH